jgi:hypothetical protein
VDLGRNVVAASSRRRQTRRLVTVTFGCQHLGLEHQILDLVLHSSKTHTRL